MEQFRYGSLWVNNIAYVHPVDVEVERENGFYLEVVAEFPEISVYYAPNGYLNLSMPEPEIFFKEDTSCRTGHLLVRLKNSKNSDVLWSIGIYTHGSLYRITSALLQHEGTVRSRLEDVILYTDYLDLQKVLSEWANKNNYYLWAVEPFQHLPLIPQLEE